MGEAARRGTRMDRMTQAIEQGRIKRPEFGPQGVDDGRMDAMTAQVMAHFRATQFQRTAKPNRSGRRK